MLFCNCFFVLYVVFLKAKLRIILFPGKEKIISKDKTLSSETSIKGKETEIRDFCESLIYLTQK